MRADSEDATENEEELEDADEPNLSQAENAKRLASDQLPRKRPVASPSPQPNKRRRMKKTFVLQRADIQCDLRKYRIVVDENKIPEGDKETWKFEEQFSADLNKRPQRVSRDENNVVVHHILDAMSDVKWVTKTNLLGNTCCRNFHVEGHVWFPINHEKLKGIQEGDKIRAHQWHWIVENFKGNLRAVAQVWAGRESGAGILKKS